MASGTKERILDTALTLFSQHGSYGTSMNDLAGELGLTKSALYKHFTSKEEIRSALIDAVDEYYEQRFGSTEHLPPIPESGRALVEQTMHMVDFTMNDEKIIKVRKMMNLEQYHDERCAALATCHFVTGLQELFTHVFRGMAEKGLLIDDDAGMLALAYTAPITVLIHCADREPDKRPEMREKIRDFAEHFAKNCVKC